LSRIIPAESTSGSGSSPAASASTFVYRPGSIAADNVYSDWSLLIADAALQEGPKVVQIDDSIVSPAVIPSGMFNMTNITLVGDPSIRDSQPALSFSDGAIFLGLEEVKYIEMIGASTSPSIIISSSSQITFRDSKISVDAGSSEIFSASSTFDLVLDRTEFIGADIILDVTAGATTVWLENQSSILSGLVTSSLVSIIDFNCVDSNTSVGIQAGILGSSTTSLLDDSEKIFYDNAVSGLTAENVQDAIDEVASGGLIGPGPLVTDFGIITWDGTTGNMVQDSGLRHYGKSATDPTVPAPAEGDKYHNTVIQMEMTYDGARSKWLSTESIAFYFGRNGNTNGSQYYRGINGKVLSSAIGFYGLRSGTIISLAYTRADVDAATFEITSNGVTAASLLSSAISGRQLNTDADFSFGDIISVRNSAASSRTTDVQGWVRIKWRL